MTAPSAPMTKILVDEVLYEAPLGGRLSDFLIDIDKEIPHFCYHPGIGVEASCRQCQVESKGKGPRPGLTVSCREKICEGMEILTQSELVKTAQVAVMEFLLKDHPLDCPICDKAGECMLQDNAYLTGQDQSRSKEPRRHLPKRVDLGPRILLDNERCILCTRCVRFFEVVTKTPQLTVTRRGNRSVLETFMGQPLFGNYQGNVVDICPVGALTLKKFRFESRVWFLTKTKTICGLCSRGCNISVETRNGRILRICPVNEPEVNGHWICDEGRLDYDVFNLDEEGGRILEAWVEHDGKRVRASLDHAIPAAALEIVKAKGPVLALLSPFASNEEGLAFARNLQKLAIAHKNFKLAFFVPEPSGRADELLRTDEACANTKGLREYARLDEIGVRQLDEQLDDTALLFLSGFGWNRILSAAQQQRIVSLPMWIQHGYQHLAGGFAQIGIPAASPMESQGHWVNCTGRTQQLRPALRRPASVPADARVFSSLVLAVSEIMEVRP